MEDYREEFHNLYYRWYKTFGLRLSGRSSWTEVSILIQRGTETVLNIHEKADRPLRCEPWYEDDQEESKRMQDTAYFKAYTSFKGWLNNKFRKLGMKEI